MFDPVVHLLLYVCITLLLRNFTPITENEGRILRMQHCRRKVIVLGYDGRTMNISLFYFLCLKRAFMKFPET